MTKIQWLAIILFGCLSTGGFAAEERVPMVAASDTSNPYNSPIRRINPNSRQGTTAPNPQIRSTTPRVDNPRPPTLENRGIGNGDNLRRAPSENRQPRSPTITP